jgi:TolB-like protein/Flp pilus assembly protein TadD
MGSFFTELKRRNVIRVAIFYGAGGWLILQVADVLLELLDAPGGSLRLVATILALGFPFALILAWAFEITPEGIKRESALDRSAPGAAQTSRKLDVATIGLLIVAILLLAWNQFSGGDPRGPDSAGPQDLSIAVLPFVNLSLDPENEYFSEGLSEEVLNVLARIDDFRVAGRTSSFAFKGQQQDLRAIGERLGVANILEGSVRKQGNQIRVTAQLIDTRSGYHLWSDTYDRRLDDVFAIQDEIATEVVKALKQTLLAADETVIQQTAKGDVEAYNHYLRGQFHVRLRTRDGLERALEEFQQASLIDPDYAPPYAGIAMVYALLDNYNYRSLAETGELANGALDRALALDPQSDEAWAVRGLLLGQGPGASQRKDEARAALERAIEINPNNAHAHFWLSGLLGPDLEAMRAALRRAYELDPLSPVIIYRRAMEALQAGDSAELARFQGELEEVAPDWFMTWQAAGTSLRETGDIAQAARAFERVVALNPEYNDGVVALAGALELLGYRERAEALLTELVSRSPQPEYRLNLAALRARRVLPDEGFEAALAIYGPALEAAEKPKGEAVGDMAMLEIGAGRLADAERRLRDTLGIGDDEALPPPEPDTVVVSMAFATLFAAQGREEELARAADQLRALFNEMRAGGLRFSYMPIVEGMLDHLEGRPGALEAGLRASISQGFNMPPEMLAWFFPLDVGGAETARLMAVMEEGLAEERRRYEAAKAGG